MSGPGVGFEYPPKPVSWLKRDVLLFANSIGCTTDERHFLYELHPNFAVFPTYPVILPFKGDTQEVIDFYAAQKAVKIPGVPDFDQTRVVDGQRLVQFLKPLPPTSAGKKFEMRTKVLGVYDKGRPGSVLETQTDLVDAETGEVYSRAIGSAFFVGQGNWGGPKGPATVNFPPPKGKQPDVTFEDQIGKEAALLYRLNGDYNPLHATPEPGAKMGFGGAIMHGLYSFNSTCHGLLKNLGASDPSNIKEFQARFASPVVPGDKLVTSVWRTGEVKDGWEEIRFETKVEGKKTAENWVGKRLSYNGALCTVRYIGEVSGTSGTWLGVEWDDQSRGKHDGSHKGTRYFECLSHSPTAASFVRPERRAEKPTTFLEALQEKYASEVTADQTPISSGPQIIISGKVAEEIGFDKIRKQQARLHELKIVILDSLRIDRASDPSVQDKSIKEVCPKVVELNLNRNLLTRLEDVVEICSQLEALRGLRLSGNRFRISTEFLASNEYVSAFAGVRELALDEMLLDWHDICQIATGFRDLTALYASANQLSTLPAGLAVGLSSTLTSVHVEFNEFTSLSSLAGLAALPSLKNLHLKANNISTITSDALPDEPLFSKTLSYLDISYNKVSTWSFIDTLPDCFPGLTSLRLSHNPIYENPGLGLDSADASMTTGNKATVTEEAYMLTVGRLACLTSLNFSAITPNDRTNAEMFYLSRIGRQLSAAPEEDADKVIAQHRRYAELCEIYGEPVVVRRKGVNPAFLEARLINVNFRCGPAVGQATEDAVVRQAQIAKSLDIYAVKGIAGRLFGLHPLKLRLIWETGEWDPVAGFDDEAGASDDEDDDDDVEMVDGFEALDNAQPVETGEDGQAKNNKAGRWIKREVELKAMHPGPDHFLVRPGTKEDGKPGPIVPLIAVDQLPDWMQLVGIPRELDTEQTTGLTNLGIIDKADDGMYEVRLHHDKIRAILNGTERTTSRSSSGSEGKARKKNIDNPSSSETKTKTRSDSSKKQATATSNLLPGPNVTAQKQTSSFSQGEHDGNDNKPGIISSPSSASVHEESTARTQKQEKLHPAERMLSASRHNTVDNTVDMTIAGTAARGTKPIRPHMTQAMRDKPYPSAAHHSSTVKSHKPQAVKGNPDTVFCRHWCHHGRCKWGWECRYQHRMPTTLEGLREVGLKDFPTWYLLLMGGSGGGGGGAGGFPSMATHSDIELNDLLGELDMGNPLAGTTTTMFPPSQYLPPTTAPTPPPPVTHHPSAMDLRLMQGRITALLAGPNAALSSNRQRLRQVKEMRDMLTRGSGGSSSTRTQEYPHAYADLHTNASVANIRRQAERQQLGRLSERRRQQQHQQQSQHMQMCDLPVAARAARVRAVVDDDDDDGVDEVMPEDSVSRAGRESVGACVEGDKQSLLG
ncbi:hypothetical protein VMCG_10105 [Cytospora schulzeri]|uniref:CAP-Gly domain-containing protein n=1 Tax=Cytospora schulzeri TaxID=448051 RepID=A0A423VG24_9PEZI|nr:hypothetical protein VMCG_10105 [Valsa malicola]